MPPPVGNRVSAGPEFLDDPLAPGQGKSHAGEWAARILEPQDVQPPPAQDGKRDLNRPVYEDLADCLPARRLRWYPALECGANGQLPAADDQPGHRPRPVRTRTPMGLPASALLTWAV